MTTLSLTLRSNSMAPTIPEGAKVISTPHINAKVGDIIVLSRRGQLVVHRFVASFLCSTWGLERGDGERIPKLFNGNQLRGVVIMPSLPASPTRRSPSMELLSWALFALKSKGAKHLRRCFL